MEETVLALKKLRESKLYEGKAESLLKSLIKNGRVTVSGIKEYRDLEALATEEGYSIEQVGHVTGNSIHIKLVGLKEAKKTNEDKDEESDESDDDKDEEETNEDEDEKVDEAIQGFNSWNGTGSLSVGTNPEIDALVAKSVGIPLSAFKANFYRYTVPAIGGTHLSVEGSVSGTLEIVDKSAIKEVHGKATKSDKSASAPKVKNVKRRVREGEEPDELDNEEHVNESSTSSPYEFDLSMTDSNSKEFFKWLNLRFPERYAKLKSGKYTRVMLRKDAVIYQTTSGSHHTDRLDQSAYDDAADFIRKYKA